MKCKLYKQCGSCAYLDLDYKLQLEKKKNYVTDLFKKEKLNFVKVHDVLGAKDPFHYRNKIIIGFNQKGEPGLYEENSHRIIPYESCLLHDEVSDQVIQELTRLFRKYRISIYNEDKRKGFLRHVLIRRGVVTNQTMVVLVTTSLVFPGSKDFVRELIKAVPSVKTVVLNLNTRKTSIVLGNEEKVLYGKGFIEDTLCGLTFKISPKSFYQINHDQCEVLYNKALDLVKLTKKDVVIDTYCGIGTIGMVASKKVNQVLGVELNKDAIRDAKVNARMNRISNIDFVQADATKFMVELAKENVEMDVLIMDPPRSGTTKEFIQAVNKLKPKRIVYISCDPSTQVRDLVQFKKIGYNFNEVFPVDLFPYTKHVETVCLLSKLHEAKHHVNVKLDMDEMDLTAAESKATYEEIKKYVAEHNDGMKVSNLYIAQIKQKHGIIERENYNKPKSEKGGQPECPKEKEIAIEEALKYFQMIPSES